MVLAPPRPGGRSVTVTDADFFVSYTGADQAWAEWIAERLEAAGYTTVLQAWDFRPGSDFLHQMQQATSNAQRTVAVLSPTYFGSRFGEAVATGDGRRVGGRWWDVASASGRGQAGRSGGCGAGRGHRSWPAG